MTSSNEVPNHDHDEEKPTTLRRLVKEGFDAIDRGEFQVITKENLEDFMESVSASARTTGEVGSEPQAGL